MVSAETKGVKRRVVAASAADPTEPARMTMTSGFWDRHGEPTLTKLPENLENLGKMVVTLGTTEPGGDRGERVKNKLRINRR